MDASSRSEAVALMQESLSAGHLPPGLVVKAQEKARQEPNGALPSNEMALFWVMRALVDEQWSYTTFAYPLANSAMWLSSETLAAGFPQFAYQLDRTVRALENRAGKRGSIESAIDELEGLGVFYETLRAGVAEITSGWPELWPFNNEICISANLMAQIIQYGSQTLRRVTCALINCDLQNSGDLTVQDIVEQHEKREAADTSGVGLPVIQQLAKALLLGELEAAAFMDPLNGGVQVWADSNVIQTSIPEFHTEVVRLLQARVHRSDPSVSTSYPESVISLARYLCRISRTMATVADGWPFLWEIRGKLPECIPSDFDAMIREGICRLRGELGSFPSFMTSFPVLPESSNRQMYGMRDVDIPALSMSHFPSWRNVEGFSRFLVMNVKRPEELASPLTHLEIWYKNEILRKAYPDLASKAKEIDRFYLAEESPQSGNKAILRHVNSLCSLSEMFQHLADILDTLGVFWPVEWRPSDLTKPVDSPVMIGVLLSTGAAEISNESHVYSKEISEKETLGAGVRGRRPLSLRLTGPLSRFRKGQPR
ncbi:hypothetical protein [Streptomyces sp. NPDC055085]